MIEANVLFSVWFVDVSYIETIMPFLISIWSLLLHHFQIICIAILQLRKLLWINGNDDRAIKLFTSYFLSSTTMTITKLLLLLLHFWNHNLRRIRAINSFSSLINVYQYFTSRVMLYINKSLKVFLFYKCIDG